MNRTRVFLASSLDGFIAGPHDEIDWLEGTGGEVEDTFGPFFAEIGALLMGRRTFDVLCGFEDWPYGDTPLLVATHRPLHAVRSTVRPLGGSIVELVEEARRVAGDRDVYIDGGRLVRSALDAGLVDEITVTMIPIVLGAGLPLFAGVARRHPLELGSAREIGGGLVQLVYRPRGPLG